MRPSAGIESLIGRVSRKLSLVVLAAVTGAVLTIYLVDTGAGENAAAPTPLSIQGPQVRLGDLTYNVTNVRLLDRDKPAEAPYLVNNPVRPKGRAYLGVFIKIYNHDPNKDLPSAPGYLLEPQRNPSLVAYNQASESPYSLDQGGTVPAGGVLPVPGSPSAAGPIAGALLLYVVSDKMTAVQPFRLIINTGTQLGAITLPPVPKISASDTDHG